MTEDRGQSGRRPDPAAIAWLLDLNPYPHLNL